MKVIREPIAPLSTPRRCNVCPEPAVWQAFKLSGRPNKEGKQTLDKSSRRFFCMEHGTPKHQPAAM